LVGKQSARGDDVEMIARKILREKSAQVLLALLAIVHFQDVPASHVATKAVVIFMALGRAANRGCVVPPILPQ
jgi:hypothetical protein